MDQYKKDLIMDAVNNLQVACREDFPRKALASAALALDALLTAFIPELVRLEEDDRLPVDCERVMAEYKDHPEILLPYIADAYAKNIYGIVEKDLLASICSFSMESEITFTVDFKNFASTLPFCEGKGARIAARLEELSNMGVRFGPPRMRGRKMATFPAFQDSSICSQNFEFLRDWCLNTFSAHPRSIEIEEDEIKSMTVRIPMPTYVPNVKVPHLPEFLSKEETENTQKDISMLSNAIKTALASDALSSNKDLFVVGMEMRMIEDVAGVCGPIMRSEERLRGWRSKWRERIEGRIRKIALKKATPELFDRKGEVEIHLDSIVNALGLTVDEISLHGIEYASFALKPSFIGADKKLVTISGIDFPDGYKINDTKENVEAITAYIRKWVSSVEEPTITAKDGYITRMDFSFSDPLDLMRIMEAPISDQNNDD